jgi:hypothetical protein
MNNGGRAFPASRQASIYDLELRLKETLDLPGGKVAYPEWKRLHNEADVVLYLLRADKILAGDFEVEERVQADLEFKVIRL